MLRVPFFSLARRIVQAHIPHTQRWATINLKRIPVFQHKYCTTGSEGIKWSTEHRQSKWSNPLHVAVESNDMEKLRELATKEEGAIKTEDRGFTPLHVAAIAGSIEVVRELVKLGADVNQKNTSNACSPIFGAILHTKWDVVQELVKLGADINLKGAEGHGVIHLIIGGRQRGIFKGGMISKLVALGADVNAVNDSGFTPLIEAVTNSDEEGCAELLENGADANIAVDGATALHYVSNPSSMELLLQQKGIDLEARTRTGNTPLHHAANRGNIATVELLLKAGAKVNALDYGGNSTISFAVGSKQANVNVVALLLLAGASAQAVTPNGTLLIRALDFGQLSIVKLLIKHGVDVNQAFHDTSYPLGVAAEHGDVQAVKLLVESGAKLNGTYPNIGRELTTLRNEARSLEGNGRNEFIKAAHEQGFAGFYALAYTPLMLACTYGRIDTVKTLLSLGADVNARDSLGFSALHSTFMLQENIEAGKILLDAGADVNATSMRGHTALHVVAEKGFINAAKLLLSKGIDRHAQALVRVQNVDTQVVSVALKTAHGVTSKENSELAALLL